MSYSVLAVTAVVAVLVVDLFVYRTRMVTRRVFWAAYAIVITFQLLMNGVLTGLDVVVYDEDAFDWLFREDESLPGTPVQALRDDRHTEVTRRAQALAF